MYSFYPAHFNPNIFKDIECQYLLKFLLFFSSWKVNNGSVCVKGICEFVGGFICITKVNKIVLLHILMLNTNITINF